MDETVRALKTRVPNPGRTFRDIDTMLVSGTESSDFLGRERLRWRFVVRSSEEVVVVALSWRVRQGLRLCDVGLLTNRLTMQSQLVRH
jgi:hypothetical protein